MDVILSTNLFLFLLRSTQDHLLDHEERPRNHITPVEAMLVASLLSPFQIGSDFYWLAAVALAVFLFMFQDLLCMVFGQPDIISKRAVLLLYYPPIVLFISSCGHIISDPESCVMCFTLLLMMPSISRNYDTYMVSRRACVLCYVGLCAWHMTITQIQPMHIVWPVVCWMTTRWLWPNHTDPRPRDDSAWPDVPLTREVLGVPQQQHNEGNVMDSDAYLLASAALKHIRCITGVLACTSKNIVLLYDPDSAPDFPSRFPLCFPLDLRKSIEEVPMVYIPQRPIVLEYQNVLIDEL